MEGREEACETSFTPPTIIYHLHVSVSYMHADHKLLCHVVYIASIVSTRAITPLIVSTRATAEPVTSHVRITLIILSISTVYNGQTPSCNSHLPHAIQAIGHSVAHRRLSHRWRHSYDSFTYRKSRHMRSLPSYTPIIIVDEEG